MKKLTDKEMKKIQDSFRNKDFSNSHFIPFNELLPELQILFIQVRLMIKYEDMEYTLSLN